MLTNNDQRHAGFCGGTTAYLFQHLLFVMFESTGSDDYIETEIFRIAVFSTFRVLFLVDCAFEPWIQIAFVTESSEEERTDTLDVTIEVPISRTPLSIWGPLCPEYPFDRDGIRTILRSCERC